MADVTSVTYTPTEIRALAGMQYPCIPITLKSDAGHNLAAGTVIGEYTSGANDGKFGKYANGGANGLETAVGILAEDCDASSEDQITKMFLSGPFVEASLTGLDSAAKTDLGARSVGEYVIF